MTLGEKSEKPEGNAVFPRNNLRIRCQFPVPQLPNGKQTKVYLMLEI